MGGGALLVHQSDRVHKCWNIDACIRLTTIYKYKKKMYWSHSDYSIDIFTALAEALADDKLAISIIGSLHKHKRLWQVPLWV